MNLKKILDKPIKNKIFFVFIFLVTAMIALSFFYQEKTSNWKYRDDVCKKETTRVTGDIFDSYKENGGKLSKEEFSKQGYTSCMQNHGWSK